MPLRTASYAEPEHLQYQGASYVSQYRHGAFSILMGIHSTIRRHAPELFVTRLAARGTPTGQTRRSVPLQARPQALPAAYRPAG